MIRTEFVLDQCMKAAAYEAVGSIRMNAVFGDTDGDTVKIEGSAAAAEANLAGDAPVLCGFRCVEPRGCARVVVMWNQGRVDHPAGEAPRVLDHGTKAVFEPLQALAAPGLELMREIVGAKKDNHGVGTRDRRESGQNFPVVDGRNPAQSKIDDGFPAYPVPAEPLGMGIARQNNERTSLGRQMLLHHLNSGNLPWITGKPFLGRKKRRVGCGGRSDGAADANHSDDGPAPGIRQAPAKRGYGLCPAASFSLLCVIGAVHPPFVSASGVSPLSRNCLFVSGCVWRRGETYLEKTKLNRASGARGRSHGMTAAQTHILLVEDDAEIARGITRFLIQSGFRASHAPDARAMDRIMRDAKIDMLLLDLMLPGEDGLSICRRLRGTHNIPIIMLTAMGEEMDRVVGLELGADDYMAKPFSTRELLARIRAVMRRGNGHPASGEKTGDRLTFAGWALNRVTRQLHDPEGVRVTLTGAEFDLLAVFCERARRVLTRDQLLDLTQGRTAGPFDRSIDTLVSRIRQKIEKDPRDPTLIQTVRLGGYTFTAEVKAS
jgi:two-component system, OmpR family, response regulator